MTLALSIDVTEQTWLATDNGFCDWLRSNGLVPENIHRVEIFPNGLVITHEYHVDAEGRKHVRGHCLDPAGEKLPDSARIKDAAEDDACRVVRDTRAPTPLTIYFSESKTTVAEAVPA